MASFLLLVKFSERNHALLTRRRDDEDEDTEEQAEQSGVGPPGIGPVGERYHAGPVAEISALADRLPKDAGAFMKQDAKETLRRGRVAGVYIAGKKNAAMRGINETVKMVYGAIRGAGASGITQRGIQDHLALPHSTVWYALVKLRKRHAVNYQTA